MAAGGAGTADRATLRKTVSVDDRLLQPDGDERPHLRLLSRLKKGRKKLHNVQVGFIFTPSPGGAESSVQSLRFLDFSLHFLCVRSAVREATTRSLSKDGGHCWNVPQLLFFSALDLLFYFMVHVLLCVTCFLVS